MAAAESSGSSSDYFAYSDCGKTGTLPRLLPVDTWAQALGILKRDFDSFGAIIL